MRKKKFSNREDSSRLFLNIEFLSRRSPNYMDSFLPTRSHAVSWFDPLVTGFSSSVRARARMRARILSNFFSNDRIRCGLGDCLWSSETLSGFDDDRVISGQRNARCERHALTELVALAFAIAKPKADWSQFRSGGEAYPLQRSRGDGDDDAEAAVVVTARSRSGYWKEIPSWTTHRLRLNNSNLGVGRRYRYTCRITLVTFLFEDIRTITAFEWLSDL